MSSFYDDVLKPGERPIRKRRTWLILIVLVLVQRRGATAQPIRGALPA